MMFCLKIEWEISTEKACLGETGNFGFMQTLFKKRKKWGLQMRQCKSSLSACPPAALLPKKYHCH